MGTTISQLIERIRNLGVDDDVFRGRLERHRQFLEERIDPDFGLLDRLLAKRRITYLQYQEISAEKVPIRRSGMIIDCILHKLGSETISKFFQALTETKQEHLVNYVLENGEYSSQFCGNWPLDEEKVGILDDNIDVLTECIDSAHGLLGCMLQKKVITSRQMESISAHRDPCKKNEALLNIIRRGSQSEFQTAIEALRASNQESIADILIHGGVVVSVHSKSDSNFPATESIEEKSVRLILDILRDKTPEEGDSILETVRSLRNYQLIAAKHKRSIVFYFHCKHLGQLQRLVELLDTKELQKNIEIIYNSDLSTASNVRVTWNETEFYNAERKLRGGKNRELAPLPGFITITTTEPDMITFDEDPSEKRAMMPCGHVIGPESMYLYCQSVLQKGDYRFECPAVDIRGLGSCDRIWEYFLVRHVACLSSDEMHAFEKKMTENYLKSKKEFKNCPGCRIWCFRASNVRKSRVRCPICTKTNGGVAFTFCWQCERKWKRSGFSDVCGNPDCDGTDKRLLILGSCSVKKIGGCKECPSIRGCPECGLLIEHSGHSPHVRCRRCLAGFCFICLKEMKDGKWQCHPFGTCTLAPRQALLPKSP